MKGKGFILTMTLGAAVGATAVLMLPKNSKVYQAAEDAAESLKLEAGRMLDSLKE